jgi:hypothetical protein
MRNCVLTQSAMPHTVTAIQPDPCPRNDVHACMVHSHTPTAVLRAGPVTLVQVCKRGCERSGTAQPPPARRHTSSAQHKTSSSARAAASSLALGQGTAAQPRPPMLQTCQPAVRRRARPKARQRLTAAQAASRPPARSARLPTTPQAGPCPPHRLCQAAARSVARALSDARARWAQSACTPRFLPAPSPWCADP